MGLLHVFTSFLIFITWSFKKPCGSLFFVVFCRLDICPKVLERLVKDFHEEKKCLTIEDFSTCKSLRHRLYELLKNIRQVQNRHGFWQSIIHVKYGYEGMGFYGVFATGRKISMATKINFYFFQRTSFCSKRYCYFYLYHFTQIRNLEEIFLIVATFSVTNECHVHCILEIFRCAWSTTQLLMEQDVEAKGNGTIDKIELKRTVHLFLPTNNWTEKLARLTYDEIFYCGAPNIDFPIFSS